MLISEEDSLWCLVSNHQKLIEWHSKLDSKYKETADSIKSETFYRKNFFLALRGDWPALKERCEAVFNAPEKIKSCRPI